MNIIDKTDELEEAISLALKDLDSEQILEIGILVLGETHRLVKDLSEMLNFDLDDEIYED